MSQNTDNEWKNEAPLLAGLKKSAVEMPHDSYFESFYNGLKSRLESASEWEHEHPSLASLPKPVIEVPDNQYFNSLQERLTQLTHEKEELVQESALLSLAKKPVLALPNEAYFDALPASVMKRIHNEEAPVIKLIPSIMRYAAIAACMAGTLWLYKGLVDSMPEDSLAASVHTYEADIENMPELYTTDELSLYLSNEKAATAESNPVIEELDKNIGSNDELESMIGM